MTPDAEARAGISAALLVPEAPSGNCSMQHVDVYKSVADAAYQGAPGAYSEEAAQALLGADARLMPCATLEQAFDAVTDGRASHAVVPVENAVVRHRPERLRAAARARLGRRRRDVDQHRSRAGRAARHRSRRACARVMSHPIALAQCADFFRTNRGIEAVSGVRHGRRRAAWPSRRTTAAPRRLPRAAPRRSTTPPSSPSTSRITRRTGRDSCWSRPPHADDAGRGAAEGARRLRPAARARRARCTRCSPWPMHGLSITKIEGRPLPGSRSNIASSSKWSAPDGRHDRPGRHSSAQAGDHLAQGPWCVSRYRVTTILNLLRPCRSGTTTDMHRDQPLLASSLSLASSGSFPDATDDGCSERRLLQRAIIRTGDGLFALGRYGPVGPIRQM